LTHIDVHERRLDQDARQVRTKFAKSAVTDFFLVGDDVLAVVVDWVNYLRQEKLWSLGDPLFPATKVAVGASQKFEAVGLDRRHWSSAGPIRKIFKGCLPGRGLPVPAQRTEDPWPARRQPLQNTGGIQGVVTELVP
jgi:hypothetical protein